MPGAPQHYALLSVSNKEGIGTLAKRLAEAGYGIISTGGTAKALAEAGVAVIPIQEITGNPESFDGRMKTISFQVESGILFDRANPKHVEEAKALGVKPIDIVVCNLYPLGETIRKPGTTLAEAVEQIDVGGPTMVRAAAKNFRHVLVVVDPADYDRVGGFVSSFDSASSTGLAQDKFSPQQSEVLRRELAAKAFAHLSLYDSVIADYLRERPLDSAQSGFPRETTIPGIKVHDLRYGENPHQAAALYLDPRTTSPLQSLARLAGRELSFINLTDINAGIESVRLFAEPCAVVIKHNNPCGIALGETLAEAVERAISADPESAFGGIVVVNRPFDDGCAEAIAKFKNERHANMDIIAAPEVALSALETLKSVRKTTGVYTFGTLYPIAHTPYPAVVFRPVLGGFVLQTADTGIDGSFSAWEVVTEKKPTAGQRKFMEIGWKFISRIKSNAVIVIDKDLPMTRGIGTGQTSRVRATKIALEQAGDHAKGAILISDSFFPFGDSVRLAAKAGIAAIAEQGGSVNDAASVAAADEEGIAMVFTKRRAFWH